MKTLSIVFLILVFCIVFLVIINQGERFEMKKWALENGTDDWYSYPFIKYIGQWGNSLIGESFFDIFPLILFFSGIVFIHKMIKMFKLNSLAIMAASITVLYSLKSIAFFNRDNVLFFLGSAYAYYFYQTIFKKEKIIQLIVINATMFLFREIALLFAVLTLLVLLRKLYYLLCKKITDFFLFLGKQYPADFMILPVAKTTSDLVTAWKLGLDSILVFKPENLFKYFNNVLFGISFFFFFLKPTKWHAIIILLTFVFVYSIVNTPLYYSSVFRYSFSLVPLHLFFIGRCYVPDFESVHSFDFSVADFFWKNFVINCVKKKEMLHNGK